MNSNLLASLLKSINQGEAVALVTVTEGSGGFAAAVGQHALVWLDHERAPMGTLDAGDLTDSVFSDARDALALYDHRHLAYETRSGTMEVFVEVQARPLRLIIVGAGHIAVPLASIATICGFGVTVLDDRPQFANTGRFPNAEEVIAGPFRPELHKLRSGPRPFDHSTYVVLVTRGHQHDVECLLEILDDPLAYIGMIGSQRRIRAVFQLLETEQGIPPHKFDRVFAPVGIDIGARTPSEIAVCIMAEIINVMRNGPAVPLSEQLRRERQERRTRLAAQK